MTLTFPHDELCERSSLERSHPHFANYFTQCACANRALAKKDEEIKRVDESYLLVEEDKRLLKIELATAREEGKPEQVLTRIVDGRITGFYKDVVLLEQASVQDSKKTVKALLDEAGVTVKTFARFEVGQA